MVVFLAAGTPAGHSYTYLRLSSSRRCASASVFAALSAHQLSASSTSCLLWVVMSNVPAAAPMFAVARALTVTTPSAYRSINWRVREEIRLSRDATVVYRAKLLARLDRFRSVVRGSLVGAFASNTRRGAELHRRSARHAAKDLN